MAKLKEIMVLISIVLLLSSASALSFEDFFEFMTIRIIGRITDSTGDSSDMISSPIVASSPTGNNSDKIAPASSQTPPSQAIPTTSKCHRNEETKTCSDETGIHEDVCTEKGFYEFFCINNVCVAKNIGECNGDVIEINQQELIQRNNELTAPPLAKPENSYSHPIQEPEEKIREIEVKRKKINPISRLLSRMKFLFSNNNSFMCNSCEDCNEKLNIPGARVTLSQDIEAVDSCIQIATDGVELNCAGYAIKGNYTEEDPNTWGQGIEIAGSNVKVLNCIISKYQVGIYSIDTDNEVVNNSIFDNGNAVLFSYSNNGKLIENAIENNKFGIILYRSENTSLRNDTLVNNHWNLEVAGKYKQNIDISNSVNELPIYYFWNKKDMIIDNLKTHHLTIAESDGVIIRNLDNHGPNDPIGILKSSNCEVLGNHLFDSYAPGIIVWDASSRNIIWGNHISNVTRSAIDVSYSNSNSVKDNDIYSTDVAVSILESDFSLIDKNDISYAEYGIQTFFSKGNGIFRNRISNGKFGIQIYFNSNNNSLVDNKINSNQYGLYLGTGSSQNSIVNNKIGANEYGVIVRITGYDNLVQGNEIYDNRIGIQINGEVEGSQENACVIKGNDIINSKESAMVFWWADNPVHPQLIQGNVFYNENAHLDVLVFSEKAIELSYNQHGNYWGRSEYPYFCEYGNQNVSCQGNWDSNAPDVIDSYPLRVPNSSAAFSND